MDARGGLTLRMALTEDEQKFMEYWERERDRQKRTFYQLWVGLPIGLLFAIPILINFVLGRFWYKRADAVGNAQFNPMVLVIAVLGIAVFMAIFQKKFKWDQQEQQYQEFKAKKNRAQKASDEQPNGA
jgi:mannose/fructose/N-acetylgalactosamine-specific phosphotransferase system component IIC